MKQPGKLNMKDYTLVTDAIARMNVGSKDSLRVNKMTKSTFAPLATPENVDLGSEYAQVKDAVGNLYSSYDGEYSYTPVQDALTGTGKHKIRHRREKGRQMLSDSDSEWSSLERRQKTSSSEVFSKVSRKPTTHKRVRKKRTPIPVATPRVPPFSAPPISSNGPNPPLPPTDFNYRFKVQDNKSETLDKIYFVNIKQELSYRKPLPIHRQRSKSSDLVDNVTTDSRRPFSWCAAFLYFRAEVSVECVALLYFRVLLCNRLVMGDTMRILELPRSEEGAIRFLQDHD
ncbi:hypothetical protein J6590_026151 [Homalodisca vitripennis]|nr:hypothetical protein J6590_026151 [Homalodisca vitripennis]